MKYTIIAHRIAKSTYFCLKNIYRTFLPLRLREKISQMRMQPLKQRQRLIADTLSRYSALTTQHSNREAQKQLLSKHLSIIEIEISAFCNRTCWFCPNSIIDRKQHIVFPESVFLKLIDNLAEIDYAGSLNFHRFNETLANKDLILKRLSQARALLPNAKLGIFSNGDYLTRAYLDELKDAGMSYMLMSYYLKKNEAFDKASVLKPAMDKMAHKLGLTYNIAIDSDTQYGVYFDYDGVDYLLYRCWNPQMSGGDRGGVIEQISKRQQHIRTCGCYFPLGGIYIDYNCLAMPCCNLRSDIEAHKAFIMGDMRNEDLFSLFSNEKYIALRQALSINGEKMGPCATCHYDSSGFLNTFLDTCKQNKIQSI